MQFCTEHMATLGEILRFLPSDKMPFIITIRISSPYSEETNSAFTLNCHVIISISYDDGTEIPCL